MLFYKSMTGISSSFFIRSLHLNASENCTFFCLSSAASLQQSYPCFTKHVHLLCLIKSLYSHPLHAFRGVYSTEASQGTWLFYMRGNFPPRVRALFFTIGASPLEDNYVCEIWFWNTNSLERKFTQDTCTL